MEPPLAAAVSTAMQRTAILTHLQYSAQIVPGTGEVIAKKSGRKRRICCSQVKTENSSLFLGRTCF